MSKTINPTDKGAVCAALVAFMADPVVNIKAGDSGHLATLDFRKVHPDVIIELVRQGGIKPLTDISRDIKTEETWQQVNDRRRKRIENWYAGDYSVRGGGVADPVAVQMKEEIIATYIAHGASPGEARKFVKGTAAQFIAQQAAANTDLTTDDERQAWITERLNHYRGLAETTLRERGKSTDKLDLSAIKL